MCAGVAIKVDSECLMTYYQDCNKLSLFCDIVYIFFFKEEN